MTASSPMAHAAPTPDEAGFRSWMAVRGPVLRRKAYLMTGDWYAADDLAQDVLVAVYSRWSRVAKGSNVDAYANRVLVGKYVDAARRPWRRETTVDTQPDRPDATAEAALDAVESSDSRLLQALAGLSPEHRAVVVLRFADDLSVDEIAHALDIPAGTVKSRLSRALQALRTALGPGVTTPADLEDQP
ncbi:MAG: RNA polymerase sigma factor [Candidatus Nanopelagicales bacterium]